MDRSEFIQMLVGLPEIYGIPNMPPEHKEKLCGHFLDVVVKEVCTSYEWDFTLDVADEPTVANQSDYKLKGNNNDCWRIDSVRIGTGTKDEGYDLLDRKYPDVSDAWLTGRNISSVGYWVPQGFAQNYPIIRLIDTPVDATKTLRYRYWSKSKTFENYPSGFAMLFITGVKYMFGIVSENLFRKAIRIKANNYERTGGADDPVGIEPRVISRNNQRANMYGYNGDA